MISLKPLTALCFATLLGVSQAFGNVDCVGHWGTCSDKCLHTFHIDTKRSGDGKKCGMKDGTKQPCTGDKCKKPPHSSSGLHSIFNAAEVEKCYGLISKSPQLVRADKRIFLISACRRGGPNSYFKSSYKSNYTASAHSEKYAGNYTASVARRRLDPTSKSVAIIKSSSDDGKTWGDFRVVSQHGFDGSHYYGTKGIYDKKRKRLIIQYTEGHNDDTITLWQVTSDDEGKTFSKPRDLTHYIAKCAPKGGKPRSGNTAGNRIQLPLKQYPNGRVVFGTGAAFVPRSGSAAWMCLWYSEDGGET